MRNVKISFFAGVATKGLVLLAGVFVVTTVASPARGAIVVTIDDRTDTVSATVDGLATDKFRVTRPLPFDLEAISILLIGVLPAPAAANTLDEFLLREPSDGSISDTIGFLAVRGSSDYSILFVSDSGEIPVPRDTDANIYGEARELGVFQTFKLNPDSARGELPLPPGAPDITLRVASDVEPVAEPMTLTLLAVGCCGVVAYASLRRLRRSAQDADVPCCDPTRTREASGVAATLPAAHPPVPMSSNRTAATCPVRSTVRVTWRPIVGSLVLIAVSLKVQGQ